MPTPSLAFLMEREADTQVVHKAHIQVHDYIVHTKSEVMVLEQSQHNIKQQFYHPSQDQLKRMIVPCA
jgi:hypothetical protein